MVQLLQSAFIEALGWSLVDSLWQMGALWGFYSLITLNGKKFTASQRHNLSFLLLSLGSLWFFLTVFINYQHATRNTTGLSISYLFSEGFTHSIKNIRWLELSIPYLSTLYLVAVCFYTLRLSFQFRMHKEMYSHSFNPIPQHIRSMADSLCQRMHIRRNIRIWSCAKALSPLTVGFFKPLILLPASALTRLNTEQLEAVIAHELSHIRRNDYVLNGLMMITEVLFFFNPFSRWMMDIIRKERENSCDDRVLHLGFDAWQYSQALFILGNHTSSSNQLVLAATGPGKKVLLHRIKRILKLNEPAPSFLKPLSAFFLCLFVAILSGGGPAEIPVLPRTESNVKTVAVVQKVVEVEEKTEEEKVVTITRKKIKIEEQVVVEKPSEIKEEPGSETVIEIESGDAEFFNMPVYIADEQMIEFTMIVPEVPEAPKVVTSERPLPYVPGATFYCPVDSLPIPSKKIISI